MVDWTPPSKLLVNGDFETGCLDPWLTGSSVGLAGVKITPAQVVPCTGDCLAGSTYYVSIYGTQVSTPSRPVIINVGNIPVIAPGLNYKFTGWVKGTSGLLTLDYTTEAALPIQLSPTGEWVKVEYTFVGAYGSQVQFTAQDPATIDWKIDNCTVELV